MTQTVPEEIAELIQALNRECQEGLIDVETRDEILAAILWPLEEKTRFG